MFEGWHFGYYPYGYMPKMAEPMEVDINPVQTEVYATDVLNMPINDFSVETTGTGAIVVKSDYVMPEKLVNALDAADAVEVAINNKGRIEVVYGSQVVTPSTLGTIAYNVLAENT